VRADRRLTLTLLISRAASPKALGVGDDERLLGLRCWELEFTRAVNATTIWPQSVTSGPAFAVPLGR